MLRQCSSISGTWPPPPHMLFIFITFGDSTRDEIAHDIRQKSQEAARHPNLAGVRQLIIDNDIRSPNDERRATLWRRAQPFALEPGDNDADAILDGYLDVADKYDFSLRDEEPPEAAYETDEDWLPVARLVTEEMEALTDLIWGCPVQFPPCLLQALRPHCRLHMVTFNLRSLNLPVMDSYELKLATSPRLYSLRLTFREAEGYGFHEPPSPNYQKDALMRLVAGLAPGLKEIFLYHSRVPLAEDEKLPPCPPWQGFKGEVEGLTSFTLGSLSSLHLAGNDATLFYWQSHTDFSLLRVLKLTDLAVGEEAIEFLAKNCHFPSLRTLVLPLSHTVPHHRRVKRPSTRYYDLAASFLSNLPSSLRALELRGWLPEIPLSKVLKHGLSKFRLSPHSRHGLTENNILEIAELCPSLQELAICIPRSKGDATEVAAYRALGKLRKLCHLSIALDVSPPPEGEDHDISSFDDFYAEYMRVFAHWRKGHMRDAFINMAVDEPLARSIFQTILQAQGENPSLESLEIGTRGFFLFSPLSPSILLQKAFAIFERNWVVERKDGGIIVTLSEKRYRNMGDMPILLKEIFNRIWPDGSWHSFPLCTQ